MIDTTLRLQNPLAELDEKMYSIPDTFVLGTPEQIKRDTIQSSLSGKDTNYIVSVNVVDVELYND